MNTKLIFLHVPKVAGSAFRRVVQRNYPNEYYWWGLSEEQEYLDDYRVIGGHKPFQYYSDFPYNRLHLAMVREPVSRVISLHNYRLNGARDVNIRHKWINEFGLDPDSITSTIKNSQQFRNQIDNYQCFYLSGERTFEKARKVIESHDFVIGCMDHIELFMGRVQEIVDLDSAYLPKDNVGFPNYLSQYQQDEEFLELVHKYTSEDRKLYEYILEQKVFEHIHLDRIDFTQFGKGRKLVVGLTDEACKLIAIELDSANKINDGCACGDIVYKNIRIQNRSREIIPAVGKYPVKLGYHWHQSDGNEVIGEYLRTELITNIQPGETVTLPMAIKIPEQPGHYLLSIGLMQEKLRRLDRCNSALVINLDIEAKNYQAMPYHRLLLLIRVLRNMLSSPVMTILQIIIRMKSKSPFLNRLAQRLFYYFPKLNLWLYRRAGYKDEVALGGEVLPMRARRIYERIRRRL